MGKKKIITKTSLEESKSEGNQSQISKSGSKKVKKIDVVRVYINATYNNTIITATDPSGNVLSWSSAGSLGFLGPKKATPFAASKVVAAIVEKMKNFDVGGVEVYVKGVGSGRDGAIRSLAESGFNIILLKDVTPIPHNGPRPPKVRRV
jgi:small subunit ribosomal protein S11